MPKTASYRLSWVSERGIYALHADQQNEQPLPVSPGSQEWFSWLTSIPSFTFSGQYGQLTVRQEARRGAGAYWYAYRRRGEKMLKRYLGRTADLTPAHLEEVARELAAPSASHPNQEQPALAKDPEQRFARVNDFVAAFQEAAKLPLGVFASNSEGMQASAESGPAAAQGVQDDLLPHLLMSKLQMPRLRSRLVTRSHLTQRLQQGIEQALTLVSAPAGFGKTTLLAQWIAERGLPVAWLSLSPEDNDPVRFLSYVIGALRMVDAHLGATALALLRTPQPPPPETVMDLLSNDLMRSTSGDFALVLDDYHAITAEPLHRALTSLVEHLPPQMHLIIATRADPPLPLARLRVRGQLTELRAADLRFGAAEADTFLEEVMGLHLSPQDVATLQTRTEGWIAGLQLAALSLRADLMSPPFSPPSAAAIASCWIISPRRCSRGNPPRCRRFCCRPRFSRASLARSVTRLLDKRRARRCWRPWSGPTCLWPPSTTSESGTATTTSLPTYCAAVCNRACLP